MQNEPAFPTTIPVVPDNSPYKVIGVEYVKGLSKRELFAAMAMQGVLADSNDNAVTDIPTVVKISVEYADALIAELEKKQDDTTD